MSEGLIRVEGLSKHYSSGIFKRKTVRAVDNVSFAVNHGETLALIGESGCGKTTVGRTILRLTAPTQGSVYFKGRLLPSGQKEMRPLRKQLQIIFQDADSCLNPRMRVFDLLMEPYRCHGLVMGRGFEQAMELLEMVKLTPDLLGRYPNELSGGQRQRLVIARTMALGPEFVVADEPAASLDLSIQAQMLFFMKEYQQKSGAGFLYISHELSVVRLVADRVAVMYLGRIVEIGKTEQVFGSPVHGYTRTLLEASRFSGDKGICSMTGLQGEMPSPLDPPSGCRFHPRCSRATSACAACEPAPIEVESGHFASCHFP